MKKLLIVLSVLFLMSGCGEKTDTLSCKSNSTANGMTTDTTYDIEYKDDKIKYVTITYDYNQDNTTDTDDVATTNDVTGTNDTTTTNTTGTTDTTRDVQDGVDADTDGATDNSNDANASDKVIDGAVGDAIDGAVDGVTDTILDLAGIRSTFENQMSSYDDIEGFSYKVDVDNDNEYKVIYKIDFDKISDDDLARFNIDRDLDTTRSNYENLGYTCD